MEEQTLGQFQAHSIEKTLNLNIALKTETELKNRGNLVKMVRASDKTISLKDRANFANNLNADLFISIHQTHLQILQLMEQRYIIQLQNLIQVFPSQSSNKLSKSKKLQRLLVTI